MYVSGWVPRRNSSRHRAFPWGCPLWWAHPGVGPSGQQLWPASQQCRCYHVSTVDQVTQLDCWANILSDVGLETECMHAGCGQTLSSLEIPALLECCGHLWQKSSEDGWTLEPRETWKWLRTPCLKPGWNFGTRSSLLPLHPDCVVLVTCTDKGREEQSIWMGGRAS